MKKLLIATTATLFIAASAFAADTQSESAMDFTAIKAMIDNGDHKGAATALEAVAANTPSADAFNLLGYNARKSGDLKGAAVHYGKALELDPTHKGALEYQGEMFLMMGDKAKAAENVTKLKALCPSGCEELKDLEEELAKVGS